jgi:ABC-type antimicrobial peptide transport system permease subunit
MALGADAAGILREEIRSALWLAVAGIVLGVPIVWAAGRFVSSQLFGISASDPWTILAVAAMLIGVSIAAAYVPARRAARVDPIQALRAE